MILATRKALEEETQWTKVENRMKTWLYNTMHELVQTQVFNSFIYRLLIVVETIQFLWYAIHPHFEFLWTVDVLDWLQEFLRVFQFDGYLTEQRSDSKNIFLVILYIIFAIQIIMTIIIFANIWFNSTRRKISTIMAYSIKVLGGYMLLLNTIFALPFFYIFIAAFICRDGDPIHGDMECYRGTYYIHLVSALIGTILLIPTTLLAAVLCIDLNPWSPTPFAAPRSRLILLKIAMKIGLPIWFIIDYDASAAKEFVIVYAAFWLLMLILRYRQTPCYKFSVFNLILAMEMLLFWTSLVSIFHAFIDNLPIDNIGFLFLWVGAPFIIFTYAALVNNRRKIYRKVTIKSLKKDGEVEMYILNIINLIESRNNTRKRMTLEGLLKFHMKTCTNKEFGCVCRSLHTDYLREQEVPEKAWYLWVKAITLEGIAKFPKSSRLHMLYAYVQREKLHNKFKALFEIMFAYNNKPTIEEEFSIYRYKNLIEEEMIESDMKIAENKGVNVNVIVDFENKFVDFQGVIGAAVDLHLDFWRELQETNPEIQKLQGLGSLITKSVEEVTRHYHALTLINPNHVKMLNVYGYFLHDIVNDEAEGQKIIEKAEYNSRSAMVNRQFMDNERIKYGDNADTCIITVSGELTNIGIITNTNNHITRILGFTKSEMIGQNISNIMPKFLMEIHDSFMQNYFESSDAKVIAIERIVFPINKDGYIVPCTLMAKVLPSLDDGLKLVGFIKEIDKNLIVNKDQEGEIGEEEEAHYIMYDSNTGVIHGITYGFKTEFGISASLVRNADVAMDEFTIDQVLPELAQINLDDLKNNGGLVTTIDTSNLAQEFLIEKDESESSKLNDTGEDKKFRKARVKISLFQDDEYGNISLKVLKVVEILEGEHALSKHQTIKEDGNEEENFVKVKPGEQRSAEDYNKSQIDQNESEIDSNANNELNDEIRDLKEFKAMISEKTVPRSIRMLKNAAIVIYLVMIGLVCLSLGFFSTLVDEFSSGTSTVSDAYSRHDYIANINYNLRQLQLLASDLITTNSTLVNILQAPIRANGSTLISNLRTVTLNIGDYQQDLQSHNFPSIETDTVQIESLLQTGPRITATSFADAMSQYISYATSANSAPLASFVSSSVTDSTKASFYFVRRNGLGPLRIQSESNAGSYTNHYINRIDSYDLKFKMIMIGLIVLIALSELVLIPIIFSVQRTATKVLSLFGYIPLNEINYLSTKCERYVQRYLENYKMQQSYGGYEEEEENHDKPSKTSRMGDHTYVEVNQNHEQDQQGAEPDVINASYLVEMSLEDSMRKVNGLRVPETQMMKQVSSASPSPIKTLQTETKGLMDHSSLKPMKDDYNATSNNLITSPNVDQEQRPKEDDKRGGFVQDNDEDLDLVNDRPQKLLNSRDNTRTKVTLQFCFIGLLFVVYFVVDYVVESISLKNIRNSFNHLQLISQRMPDIRFLNAFSQEVIAMVDPALVNTYTGQTYTDYRVQYQSLTLAINNQLKNSAVSDLPDDFESYVSLYNLYNGGNLCTTYYSYDANLQAQCLSIAGGLLTNGLTLSITRIAQLSDGLMSLFDATAKDSAGQTQVLNDPKFAQAEDLVEMIGPVVYASRDKFLSCFRDYLDYTWVIARVRFGLFVSLALLAFIIIWIPYLDGLKDKIFRTKGMLNMIPMELIAKNANLRSLFVNSGDILQAVK